MGAQTCRVIVFPVGNCSRKSAKQLWVNIPAVYREEVTFYTDRYEVYSNVIPPGQHKAIMRTAQATNHVERFNNTFRQRVSRLIRESSSFRCDQILRPLLQSYASCSITRIAQPSGQCCIENTWRMIDDMCVADSRHG
jgi:insertion element IS1 protein InsB